MTFVDTIIGRNGRFATGGFHPELKIIPTAKTMIIGCVDPRVDPMDIMQLEPGEAVIIRNVGGRVNPGLIETMTILAAVSRAAGQPAGDGWNLIVLQHTRCGIVGCYHEAPELLATYMGVAVDGLESLAITDPYKAVAIDVAALKSNPRVRSGFSVTGLVYDVDTGRIEMVVPPAPIEVPSA